jgi:hypothetical protein
MTEYLFIHQIAKIADYYYPPGGVKYESQWSHLNKAFTDDVLPIMKENSIIFADTLWLDRFELFNKIPVSFILITAEADVTIPYNNFKKQIDCCYSVLDNPRLKKWYSINVDFAHPKLIPIPLGLPKHIPFIVDENDKKSQYMGWVINFTIDKVSEKIKSKGIHMKTNFTCRDKKLLYSRMTLENSDNCFHDREGIRREAVDVLRSKTIEVDTSLKPYDVYLDELIHHKFCLSLPGKGMDCYRTWEALTVGVIPIVLRTRHMDSIYDGLPVLIIDDINQITSDFLNQEFERITSCIDSFDYKKLTSSYWIDLILQNLF